MTSTDYPDLTAPAAHTLGDLLPQAGIDMSEPIASSRSLPLPASPNTLGTEPADFALELTSTSVPHQHFSAPDYVPDTDHALHGLGVLDLLAAYRSGITTPTDVLTALRTRWSDPELAGGSILAVVETASAAAAEADRRWDNGTPRPLEGIFFGVKDIIDVSGTPVTAGSHLTGGRVPARDATVIARLRAAGAIPAIITATTEFACGAPHNARYGVATNPWDPQCWTGGSSTGSAGALASELIPLALGTDTGGSIRVPSALCNLTGIKPTYGLIPRTGVASLSWTLDHVGPMARSAADLSAVFGVLLGPDAADSGAAPSVRAEEVRDRLGANGSGAVRLDGLRIGIPTAWFTDMCDDAVIAAWQESLGVLRRHGAQTVPVEIPDASLLHDDFTILLTTELASNQEGAMGHFDRFDIGTQIRIARGTVPSAVDYLRALRRRAGALRATLRAFDDAEVDILVTPGVGATAPRLSDVTLEVNGVRHPMQSVVGRNTALFDHLGLPAVMTPAGFVDGMPVGVQIVGRPWSDAMVIGLARALQHVTGHHHRRAHG
ncbi:amidase [Williamsia muralis]|uniref:amidase n=1 Tax=Williamsia marianensis TaxID=85044 RepID=UPI003F140A70